MPKNSYPFTREELIKICKKAFVPESRWSNRDSADAQIKVGSCLALLKAGCQFKVLVEGNLVTDETTIWLEIYYKGFSWFEGSDEREEQTFYLPTEARLKATKGGDWY